MITEIIAGIMSFVFGLIALKLHFSRDKDNNWGIFHNTLSEMMKWEKTGAENIMLYIGWVGIITGILGIIYVFIEL